MARTRLCVSESATPDANEILVSFLEDGVARNVLLRDHADIKAALLSAPRRVPDPAGGEGATIANPARPAAEATAFAAAEAQLDGEG